MAYLESLRKTRIDCQKNRRTTFHAARKDARRVLGDEHELTVIGNRILREHAGNIAKAKAKRLVERFISRFKARRRLRAT